MEPTFSDNPKTPWTRRKPNLETPPPLQKAVVTARDGMQSGGHRLMVCKAVVTAKGKQQRRWSPPDGVQKAVVTASTTTSAVVTALHFWRSSPPCTWKTSAVVTAMHVENQRYSVFCKPCQCNAVSRLRQAEKRHCRATCNTPAGSRTRWPIAGCTSHSDE